MNPAQWLVRTARRQPAAPALFEGARLCRDYAGFARRAGAIGAGLAAQHGVVPGDRVALFMANSTAYLELLYGIWFAGAAAVPINHKLHPREAAYIVGHAGAKAVFVDADHEAGLAAALGSPAPALLHGAGAFEGSVPLAQPIAREPDDLAWLFYTSGTTGRPKGVMLSGANIAAMATAYFCDVDEVRSTDSALYAAPLSHGAGMYNFMHVMRGARHVVPASGGFDADEILTLAALHGGVSMFAAPTMVKRLVARVRAGDGRADGIRTIVYGGGPMYLADIVEAVDTMGPRFVQIYGQGESPMCITALSREAIADRSTADWQRRLASVGYAQSCVEVMVADDGGAPLPAGAIGEVLVKGPTVMQGYWQAPEETARTLVRGWLRTGDLGVLDADGALTLKDRSKDLVISGGSNIYPREVEEALLLHPAILEAAVVGVPDAEWGESVLAFVVPRDGQPLERAELDRHCGEHIARFKRPKHYRFVPALPKNAYGKVLKRELRTLVDGSAAPSDSPPLSSGTTP